MSSEDPFKSKLKEGDHVSVCFNGQTEAFQGWISGLHKYGGRMKYDVEMRFADDTTDTIPQIPSGYIEKIKEMKSGL